MISFLIFLGVWALNVAALTTVLLMTPLRQKQLSFFLIASLALAGASASAVPLLHFLNLPAVPLLLFAFHFFLSILVFQLFFYVKNRSRSQSRAYYTGALLTASVNWLSGIFLNLACWL
ncbi:MAG TPA: hypothetical protein EYO33_15980 [Phycisphaerales bacterium]|nr:hypothetical protein [Phycisphaerales bacterium]